MINVRTFDDANDLHDRTCDSLLFGEEPGRDYDWVHGTEVGLHNVVLATPSFGWDFDLKDLWIPPSRWTMMVRQYIDPNNLADWGEKVTERMSGKFKGKKGRGLATMRLGEPNPWGEDNGPVSMKTRMVQGRGTGRNVRRRWGSCMLSLAFRLNPTPTITLHSRTTYFGYLAAMDITVAHVFARTAGQIVGVDPEDMAFVWNLDLAQFHGFRSIAYALGNPETRERLNEDVDDRKSFSPKMKLGNTPGYRKVLDGYARIKASDDTGKLYKDEAFSSFLRVRKRYHTEALGLKFARKFQTKEGPSKGRVFPALPSVPVSTLDFSCLRDADPFDLQYNEEDDDE